MQGQATDGLKIQGNIKRQGPWRAIGLMSGTSLDGVDAAVIVTDGEREISFESAAYVPFEADFRDRLQAVAAGDAPLTEVLRLERMLMESYRDAVLELGIDVRTVDVVGGHGQTIRHIPHEGLTWQLGDPSWLAEQLNVTVVMDFRRRDMAAGGQGAPLVPLYHQAILTTQARPCGVLNVGGVANITWFDADGNIRASDTGPGSGLLNTLVQERTGEPYDRDGRLAMAGQAHSGIVARALQEIPFWQRPWPRSADRYEFGQVAEWVAKLGLEDACATLTALTAAGVQRALADLQAAGPLYVVGGGANNHALMLALRTLGVGAIAGDSVGLRGQTVEAECFAWLAVRRLRGLPLTTPATTGARRETVGGVMTW